METQTGFHNLGIAASSLVTSFSVRWSWQPAGKVFDASCLGLCVEADLGSQELMGFVEAQIVEGLVQASWCCEAWGGSMDRMKEVWRSCRTPGRPLQMRGQVDWGSSIQLSDVLACFQSFWFRVRGSVRAGIRRPMMRL